MKNLLFVLTAVTLFSCAQTETSTTTEAEPAEEVATLAFYGDTIATDGALSPSDFLAQMEGTDSLNVKVEAKINETCRMKGCWMTLDMGEGEQLRVRFKDYGFFVPTEGVDGKIAVIEGVAFYDTLSVDYLQHLAEDAGKSEEEIAAITEPELSVNFEAHGVIIRD